MGVFAKNTNVESRPNSDILREAIGDAKMPANQLDYQLPPAKP